MIGFGDIVLIPIAHRLLVAKCWRRHAPSMSDGSISIAMKIGATPIYMAAQSIGIRIREAREAGTPRWPAADERIRRHW
jgi:hypothetical protein